MTAAVFGPAYIEPLAHVSRFQHPWLPWLTFVCASPFTLTVWRAKGLGNKAAACTLADTILTVAAVSLGVGLTAAPVSYAYAALLGVMVTAVHARLYSLTLIFALALVAPSMGLLLVLHPDPVDLVIVGCSCLLALWVSHVTGETRLIRAQNDGLRRAVAETAAAADHFTEVALSSMVVDVAGFLHEMRSAVMSLTANLDFLAHADPADSEIPATIKDMVAEQQRLRGLIDGIIYSLRRRATATPVYFDLERCLALMVPEIHEGISVVLGSAVPEFRVRGRPEHLREALANIIRNARQAGATSATITCETAPSAVAVMLRVRDNGPGLSAAALETVFRPFATSGKPGGLGLGLYVTRRRVELMDGSIHAGNHQDGGAVFEITLPGAVGTSLRTNGDPEPGRPTC